MKFFKNFDQLSNNMISANQKVNKKNLVDKKFQIFENFENRITDHVMHVPSATLPMASHIEIVNINMLSLFHIDIHGAKTR